MPVVVAAAGQPAAQVALVAAAKAAPRLLGHKVLTMVTMELQIPEAVEVGQQSLDPLVQADQALFFSNTQYLYLP
jgi:hypothetical protein